MDCNKEEGEKCLRLGRKFLADGDLDKALRFLQKSSKLYPTAAVDQLISETEARIAGGNKEGSPREEARTTSREAPSPSIPKRAEAAPSAAGGSDANYTSEQKVLVDKVLKCTDYYEMLFLSKTCKEVDIKKAYKKLALQLHPDKNQAPRAEDAFKAISQAFACLSDTEKRQSYDRFGFDPDNRQPSPGGGGGGGGGGMRFRRAQNPQGAHFMFDEDEISPEEIFNMFFFGVPPRGGRAAGRGASSNVFSFQRGFGPQTQQRPQARSAPHQHAHQHRPRAQQDQAQQGGFFTGFLQLLPILLMLGILLFSSVLREEPLYKLEKTGAYTVQMETRENQFKYFVRQDFNMAHRSKVEEEVDTRWVQYLRDSCYAQMQEKKTLINKARWAGSMRTKLMDEANKFPLSACERLEELGFHVPNYSR